MGNQGDEWAKGEKLGRKEKKGQDGGQTERGRGNRDGKLFLVWEMTPTGGWTLENIRGCLFYCKGLEKTGK